MAKAFIGALAGMAMAGLATTASASTVSLDYLGSSISLRGDVVASTTATPTGVTLGALEMQVSGTTNRFLAWCIEFASQIERSAEYTLERNTSSFLTSQQADDLSRLFTGYAGETLSNVGGASFQLAIWEIVEETTELSPGVTDYNVSTGVFQAQASNVAEAATQANEWLESLGKITPDTRINFLSSTESQDILTIAPIPLPPSVLLLGAGLGALVVMRRRGKLPADRA